MIYQLVRLIHGLKIAMLLGMLLLAIVIAESFGFFGGMGGAISWGYLFGVAMFVSRVSRAGPRCTIFEATLPIRPREILSAQIVFAAAVILAPALLFAALLAATSLEGRGQVVVLLEIASVGMLWVISLNSTCLRRMSSPGVWREIALGAAAVGATVAVVVVSKRHFVAPEVFGICAVGSAALLVRIWRRAPETLEIAGREATRAKKDAWRLIPSFSWLPVARTIFRWQFLAFICVFTVVARMGEALFVLAFVAIGMLDVVPPSKWIWSLPIPRLKFFSTVILCRLGPFFVAMLACLLAVGAPARAIVASLAATAIAG